MGKRLNRRRWAKVARYSAYGLAALAAALVAAALIAPEFLDRPAVEAEIQRKLSHAVNGQVAWENLQVRLLPTPRGVLRGVGIDMPETPSVRAEAIEVRLQLLPLLRGRAEIVSVSVSRPELRMDFAPAPPAKDKAANGAAADSLADYRSAARRLAQVVQKFAPDTVIEIEDAAAGIRTQGMPPIELRDLSLRVRTGARGMDIDAATAGNFFKSAKLSARIEFADLSGVADVEIVGLEAQHWLEEAVRHPVAVPAIDLRLRARIDAQALVECEFETALAGNRLGKGTFRHSFKDGSTSAGADFDIDLAETMRLVRRLLPKGDRAALAVIESIGGRAQGRAKFFLKGDDWNAAVDVLKSDSTVQLRQWPAPLGLAAGSVDIGPDAVKVDRAALSMLDADIIASATIGYGKQLQIEGAISEGKVGEKFLAWVWQAARIPPNLELKVPIRVAAQHIAWGPKQALDLDATAQFDSGPGVVLALGWTPGALNIRRFSIKDGQSDASIALRIKGLLLDGKFSGALDSKSVANMLKNASVLSGSAAGEMRFTVDREHPERTTAEGNLKGEAFDLTWLAGRPLRIDRVDLAADAAGLHIGEASVSWAEQRVTLRGQIRRGPSGPIIDAQIDSPGVVVDALLPPTDKPAGDTAPTAERRASGDRESKLWPLPFTGRIAVRSDFVKYVSLELAPVVATLVLEEQRARLDLAQGRLCGISMPLTVEATPKGFSATAHLVAQKQEIGRTAHCLSDAGILITGNYDFTADLKTQGKAQDLLRNLDGTVSGTASDGRVQKFALLGNILSMKNITSLLKEGGPKLDEAGFPYRSITLNGHFESGRLIVEESAFHSDAVDLAATGWISILDYDSRLAVLVAPLGRLDEIARKIPVLGYMVGGTLTSVPVSVTGDIRDPLVLPLGPEAITSELLGIFTRTLKLPADILAPLKAKPAASPPPGQ